MKKIKISVALFAAFACLSASAATYVMTLDGSPDFIWTDNNKAWTVDGVLQDTPSLPTAADDVVLDGRFGGWWRDIVDFNDDDYTLTAKSLTLNTTSFSGTGARLNIHLTGDFVMNSVHGSYETLMGHTTSYNKIYVGGDMIMNTGAVFKFVRNNVVTYSESNPTLEVVGSLTIANGKAFNIEGDRGAWWDPTIDSYIKLGGLNSANGIFNSNGSAVVITRFVFGGTAFKGGDFTGSITRANDSAPGSVTFIMNDTTNGGKIQTLRLNDSNYDDTHIAPASDWGVNATVQNGRMDISTDGVTLRTVDLTGGGKFGVASSASDARLGTVNIGTLNWTSGTDLVFDLMQGGESDMIYLDTLNFVAGESYNILFDLINFDDLDGETYDIIVKNSGAFSQADVDKLTGKTSDGLYTAIFELGGTDGNAISVSFVVPEPATVAAILGALALGFAAWRRKK